MGTSLIRIDSDIHAYIMKTAQERGMSGAALVTYWVKESMLNAGEITVAEEKHEENKRPYQEQLYPLSKAQLDKIVSPVPSARIHEIPPFSSLIDTVKSDSQLPSVQYDLWYKCDHMITGAIAYISGKNGKHLKVSAASLLKLIDSTVIKVKEESAGIFTPANKTAETILSIININIGLKKGREYFSVSDIYILWECGWDINYEA